MKAQDKPLIQPIGRTLRSGRVVPDKDVAKELTLSTKCPEKWVAIDLETGEVWSGGNSGWRKSSRSAISEICTSVFGMRG